MDISKDGLVRTFEKTSEQARPIVYSSHIVDKNISLLQKINEGLFKFTFGVRMLASLF